MIAKGSKIGVLVAGLLKCLSQLEWLPILLVRLSVGLLFFESGRGKLFVKLDELMEFFVKLGIPFPHFNAVFVSTVEFVGGDLSDPGPGDPHILGSADLRHARCHLKF